MLLLETATILPVTDMQHYDLAGHPTDEQHLADIDGLVQYCSISIANALDILQSCTKPSMYFRMLTFPWLWSEKVYVIILLTHGPDLASVMFITGKS